METTDYCSYELSKALKAAGFNEPCDHYYAYDEESKIKHLLISASPSEWDWNYSALPEFVHPECSAPHIYHAQKWLREKKDIHVNPALESVNEAAYACIITRLHKESFRAIPDVCKHYTSYNEALRQGISVALQLLDNEKKNDDMRYEDIDKAMDLKYDYDKLKRISNAILEQGRNALYVAIWNNSERMELPKSTAKKLAVLIQQELMNVEKQIEEL